MIPGNFCLQMRSPLLPEIGPYGVAVGCVGGLFVSDEGNDRI